jgi:thiamine-monophosphate kinase
MVRRTTARPGDLLAVTGAIGDAALGLALGEAERPAWAGALTPVDAAFLLDRYRRPQPRLALAGALRDLASAAMDVSDGLAGDAAKMLRASGVTGTIGLDRLPLSRAARAALAAEPALLDRIASGGDDYEILFTLRPESWDAMARQAASLGLAATAIGAVEEGTQPVSLRLGGSAYALATPSFQHFGTADT